MPSLKAHNSARRQLEALINLENPLIQEPFESLRSPHPSALFEDGGTDAFAILDTITIISWAMSCGFCCFLQLYRHTISSFTWDRLFINQVLDVNYWFCQVCWFLVKIPKFNTGFNNHVLVTFAQPNHRPGQLGRVDWETGCGIVMRGLKDLGWLCGLGEALGVTFAAAGDSTPVKLPCLCSDIGVGWHW